MSNPAVETDPRFPSGKWVGFFIDKRLPGRHQMEMVLTFTGGRMSGEGRDRVGKFTIEGSYDLADGRCEWVKRYMKAHAVHYKGFGEGRGIWGTWEMHWGGVTLTGGFNIWPEGMPDPTQPKLSAEADLPVEYDDPIPVGEEVVVGS